MVGSHWSEYDCVSNLLSSCAALTPSVLRLLPNIAMYLSFVVSSPLTQTPEVYEPAEELVGDQAVVDAEPVGELAFGAAHASAAR